jgi:hypothetical protein
MHRRYEVRVRGFLSPTLRAMVSEMRYAYVPRQTTIRGRLSPGELCRLLRRLDQTGVTLINLNRADL